MVIKYLTMYINNNTYLTPPLSENTPPSYHNNNRRERTPPEVREQREREKELQRLDKDTRTVFAYNLSLKADERDLFDFFSDAGTVIDIRIICDRNTKRSKGFAYIEFEDKVRGVCGRCLFGGDILEGMAYILMTIFTNDDILMTIFINDDMQTNE